MASMDFLDVKELAEELDDLKAADEEGEEIDEDRLSELEDLETELGDLHLASRDKEPFVNDRDFREYAMEQAEEMGITTRGWPFDYIDWDAAADALQSDYTSVEFDGQTYWYRA